jgi:hypothetical protein
MSDPRPRATADTSALDPESLPRLSWPASPEELRAYVTASRAQQGLPAVVTDPAALERAASLLRLTSDGGGPDAMRPPVQRKPQTARREVARETTP